VPTAIADHIEKNTPLHEDGVLKGMQKDGPNKKKFNLFVGASVGPEVEDRWARMDMCVVFSRFLCRDCVKQVIGTTG
jgi:acetyl-CoA hydrolase